MLETLRKQGASIVIYAIFGILIAVFVINFGAQSVGTHEGCTSSASETVLTVNGDNVGLSAWRLEYYSRQGRRAQKAAGAMDALIKRELLADEAERRGMNVNDALVDDELKAGHIYLSGEKIDVAGTGLDYFETQGQDRYFSFERLQNLVRSLNLSIGAFKEQERREILAAMMTELLAGSARASKDEALHRFLAENTTVEYDAVRFQPIAYRAALRIGDADLDRYLAGHDKEVRDKYAADERSYKGVKPQVRVRQIFVAKAAPKAEPPKAQPEKAGDKPDDKAAPAKPDDKAAPGEKAPAEAAKADKAPAAGAPDPGLEKLTAAKAAIDAKKKTFADAARELDSDEAARASGGDLGWRTKDAPALDDPKLSDKVRELEVGKVSDVITTDAGYYLLTVEDKREGDLTYDQVKRDIAVELAKDTWSDEAARRAAIAALDEARAGKGKNLRDMFKATPREEPGGFGNEQLQQLINDPNIPEDTKKQIIQQMIQHQLQEKQGAGGQPGQQGRIEWESADEPAAWTADDTAAPAPGGGSGSGSGSAAPAAGAGGSGSGSGSAGGAGSGSAAATTATATAPAAPAAGGPVPDIMKPSSEVLPALGEMKAPTYDHLGPMPRGVDDVGLGKSKELMAALFDQLGDGNVAPQIYKVGGDYVVVQMTHKVLAEVKTFEKNADQAVADLARERGERVVQGWLKEHCAAAVAANKIKYDANRLNENDDQGHLVQSGYYPCFSMGVEPPAPPPAPAGDDAAPGSVKKFTPKSP